jgi:hypothetical protein
MNSSMKPPLPSGKSLNDCLMKGLSALMDLFMVTELHRYALTKDLSKFYQQMDTDELTHHHVRRVVWCGGDQTNEPNIYVTAMVNFFSRGPAGGINHHCNTEGDGGQIQDWQGGGGLGPHGSRTYGMTAGGDCGKRRLHLYGCRETSRRIPAIPGRYWACV